MASNACGWLNRFSSLLQARFCFSSGEKPRFFQPLDALVLQAAEVDAYPFRFFSVFFTPVGQRGTTEATELALGVGCMVRCEDPTYLVMAFVGIESVGCGA